MVNYEQVRQSLQATLDNQKNQAERNRMGQFATPIELARDIIAYSIQLLPDNELIRFLDPAIGTGCFYSALRNAVPLEHIQSAEGYEIDKHYGLPAKQIWANTPLDIHLDDFTLAKPPVSESQRFNFLICNPPYVRHHHIATSEKTRLQEQAKQTSGVHLSGLAGLYCYFLLLAHTWMKESAVAAWLIPSEFMDVNYGRALKNYLLNRVTLLRIHRFDPNDLQFADALVSTAIVWFRKENPPIENTVEFTFGGTIVKPSVSRSVSTSALRSEAKWTRFPISQERKPSQGIIFADLFDIKRGIATGSNQFFILTREQIEHYHLPKEFLRPILPSPRYLLEDEIGAETNGEPAVEQKLFLLDCHLPEDVVKIKYPSLWDYLKTGKPTVSERYICRHRNPWYSQEVRPPTLFLCTYIGRTDTQRGRPFRFLLNHSQATAANVYLLLYPKPSLAQALANDPALARKVWQSLNEIHTKTFLAEGRVYGGSLYKMEPKELGKVSAEQILALIPESQSLSLFRQADLFQDTRVLVPTLE